MNGVLLVDKPEGITSAGVIRALAGRLKGVKVGHVGTLDPFASGLLPLCLGEATKVARHLLLERKDYEGTIRLGTATDTLDPTGVVVAQAPVPAVSAEHLAATAAAFTGRIRQRPPMYSALKRGGVPLYALARRGIDVAREAREVTIERLDLTMASEDGIDFRVQCTKGTYVRVLAEDIGRHLGTVAHLARLRRTRVGRFGILDALPLSRLCDVEGEWPIVPIREALADLPSYDLPDDAIARLRQGQQATLATLPAPAAGGAAALVTDGAGRVVALIEKAADGTWRIARLLGE